MKKSKSTHLFPKKRDKSYHLPTKRVERSVLLLLVLFFILYLKYKPYDTPPHAISSVVEYIFTIYQFLINQTLGIVHEAGHGVCYILPCPKFFMVLNGTLFQWLFPLGIAYYYKRRGNMMAFYLGLFILGIAMDYTSWYMSTAQEGPLVPAAKSFLGVGGLHDFYYIFNTLGILAYAPIVSGVTKVVAHLLMIASLFALLFEAFSNKMEKKTL